MKIQPGQINPALEQERKQHTDGVDKGFGNILADEIAKGGVQQGSAPAPAAPLSPLASTAALLQTQQASRTAEVAPVQPVTTAEQNVMRQMETLLDDIQSYANTLRSSGQTADMKNAYAQLERIQGSISSLRESVPDLPQDSQRATGLKNMVDEVEILAVTETYKFNRGDYI